MSNVKSSGPTRSVSVLLGALLLVALVVGVAPNTSTRWIGLGEALWPGYAAELRADPTPPACEVELLQERAASCVDAPAATPSGEEVDPFADPPAEPDPFAEEVAKTATVSCAAVRALAESCADRWSIHTANAARITPAVRFFRGIDHGIGAVALWPFSKHMLVVLVLLGGIITSMRRAHIALRSAGSPAENRLAEGAQLLVHLAWMVSVLNDYRVQTGSSAETENAALPVLWGIGFAILAGIHAYHLLRPPELKGTGRSPLVVPLYAWMSGVAFAWFLYEGHASGQAIYLHKFVQIPSIYIGIGLYIWAGMLLARTSLATRVFDILLPWQLPPAILGWLVVVLAALPTAYSGASGIFVIAAGAVIFERLTAAGASPRMALAATAMSGSLGVVLRPCLVVVLVSVLNKNVTTDALFGWGRWVFILTASLFLIAMLLRHDHPFVKPDLRVAGRQSLAALRGLLPFAGLVFIGLVIYGLFLGTTVNEHTAALVLPGLMIALAAYDRMGQTEGPGFWTILGDATSEASHHIGALLFVMVGSVGIGGVVERAELLSLLPTNFGSPFLAMSFLVVVMVLVGMTMDALGAVILVSVSLAHVAETNGIDPVHFWMMVLCAFELGYLTPPVALNHLLARQVIGEAADVSQLPASSFFERHEHILLPMGVMATALLLVAFVPLFV